MQPRLVSGPPFGLTYTSFGIGCYIEMVLNVTYYLGLHNAISFDCTSYILPRIVKMVVWALKLHQ